MSAWEPLGVPEVAALFAPAGVPWWIAGGHAIELFTGAHRLHHDIDVLLLHRDQAAVHRVLDGWDCRVADPPGAGTLRPWRTGEILAPHLHDVWCRPSPADPWLLQVMLDDSDGDEWVSRRCADVRRPLGSLGGRSADGVPYLLPEVQLFYKAKEPRPQDQWDFAVALPLLSPAARTWFEAAATRAYPGFRPDNPSALVSGSAEDTGTSGP